jgi:hypothetical protein
MLAIAVLFSLNKVPDRVADRDAEAFRTKAPAGMPSDHHQACRKIMQEGKLTRLTAEKRMPLMTKAPAESPNVTARVATVRGTRMKNAAVLKTSDAPKAAAPRSTTNNGPAGATPNHKGVMNSNPCSSPRRADGRRDRIALYVLEFAAEKEQMICNRDAVMPGTQMA